jgi:hypothetical protein
VSDSLTEYEKLPQNFFPAKKYISNWEKLQLYDKNKINLLELTGK